MIRKSFLKKAISLTLSAAMFATLVLPNSNMKMFANMVKADNLPITTLGAGSIGMGSNESDAAKLPRTKTQGTYRFTTNNYNNNHQALDTNDWASNWLWDLEGNRAMDSTGALSGTAYAFPLSFLMKNDGLRVTKPAMTSNKTNVSAYNIKDNDTLCDFNFIPDWICNSSNVDEISDWSYQAIAANPSNSSQYMKTTMTQGSPFMFLEFNNSNVFYIEKLRETFPSDIIFEGTYAGSKMIVFRTNDITSSVNGYPGLTYQYYALFLPEGANIEHLGTKDTTNNDRIGKLKITLPSNKTYVSFAWVDESRAHDDTTAINFAREYRPYAFNFITDTRADYSYDESNSTVTTTYRYTVAKKTESTADGTIMGILPHQYKNMSGYSYMNNHAITLRGTMKFIKGSSYSTKMSYKGILPYMPDLAEDDTAGRAQLQSYINDFMNTYMTGAGDWTLANDEGNETYYHAKKLNRAAQVIAAANSIGDETSARRLLNGLEANLEEWFTYSGANDKNYFTYLGEGVGVLLGFPTSFNAVDQFNDHHFHYGYFIQSAACVGLWDKAWLNSYKDVIKQLIYDIACPYRDNSACVADCGNAYPYLRSFSPYEGHSWASGYEDERTGNNQESTSEAINAWAGIILFGELTGDTKIRDLGIYLYTTEIAAADNYWFDLDEDIYHIEDSNYEPPAVSMVWGGKADYATWFGLKYTQGIQICPMQSWSFYYLNGGSTISGKDYIKKFYNFDKNSSLADGGSTAEWNDMWASYYALADPQYAMNTVWTKKAINDGESQAHTYHYIQSLIDYGTPDLSYTSNNTFSSVFEKNGVYTYAVYNPSDRTKTVAFKDSTGKAVQVQAAPNNMTLFNSQDIGKPSYTVEYYAKDLNSNQYSLMNTSIKYANAGTNVTADIKDFVGYSYDSSNTANRITGNVSADNSLVLKVYYSRKTYTVSYQMNGGSISNSSLYPASYVYGQTYSLDNPVRDGYDFYGWYTEASYDTKLPLITEKTNGNLTLYAKWIPAGTILINEDIYLTFDPNTNGIFTIVGDTGYDSVNVLYRIVDTEAEAAELAATKEEEGFVSWGMDRVSSGWTRTENFSANSGKYITFYFIRYDSQGGYKTNYGYGRIGAGSVVTEPETKNPTTTKEPETTVPITTTPSGSGNTDPSTVTDWTPVNGNSNIFYYICDGKSDKVSVKPQQQADGIYIAYTLAAVFDSITWNGVSKELTPGAFYVIPNTDVVATGYYTLKVVDYYKNETVTILFKVQGEAATGEPATTVAPNTTSAEDVTGSGNGPMEVFGQVINSTEQGIIFVVWGQNQEQMELGQKYNVYVDGQIAYDSYGNRLENVECMGVNVPTTEGTHTVRITAVYNGVESKGVTGEVTVVGNAEVPTSEKETTTSGEIKVEGFQISTTAKGIRTVYKVDSVLEGKEVEEAGLVYGISDRASSNDMVCNSSSAYVRAFKAEVGRYNNSTYVMTMKFAASTPIEFNTVWMVRAYAKFSDGTYTYSDVEQYSIYNVAEYVYNKNIMPTLEGHTYLYEKILKIANPDFVSKEFDWRNTLVG